MEIGLLATVALTLPFGGNLPARTVVLNVAGPAAVARTRALEAEVAARHGKLPPADVPDEIRAALVEPFDPTADQAPARALYDIARKRFSEVAYERALDTLVDAEAKARRAEPAPTLWTLLTEIHVMMGVVDTARGADEQAVADLRVARLLAPQLTLDAAYYPPNVRARFAQAAPHGAGEIEAHEPAGARVTIDGQAAGQAP